jgi:hypothetical protein
MEEMSEHKGIGAVGPIVLVKWNDAAQQIKSHAINGNDPTEHMAKCETLGEIIVENDEAMVLLQHWSDTDGVDILTIPKDWCQEIEVLKECISENSESQQE